MSQLLTTQTAEIVIKEEVEFPGEFRLVKREPARDRMRFMGALSGFLDLCDQFNCLFLVLIALLFRFILVDLKQLPIAQIFLNNYSGSAIHCIDLGDWNIAVE